MDDTETLLHRIAERAWDAPPLGQLKLIKDLQAMLPLIPELDSVVKNARAMYYSSDPVKGYPNRAGFPQMELLHDIEMIARRATEQQKRLLQLFTDRVLNDEYEEETNP